MGSEPEVVPPEDVEARQARRNAFATKLSSHFERRDQRREGFDAAALEGSPTLPNDDEGGDEREDEMNIDEVEPKPKKGRKGKGKPEAVGPSGQTWTPLEKQVRYHIPEVNARSHSTYSTSLQILDLKERYPGMILLVEVGYKFKFFGDDARVRLVSFI